MLPSDATGPHLFGQAMGRGEDEGISLAKGLDRSRGLAAAPAAAQVAQAVPQMLDVVARRGAGREDLFCVCFANYIIRLGEVGCMFHGDEVDMGDGQHACPQMGILGLGPIIIRKDMSQEALLGCSHRVPLYRVSRTRKSSSHWSMTSLLVSLFPSATLPWVNLSITEQDSSLPSGNQT